MNKVAHLMLCISTILLFGCTPATSNRAARQNNVELDAEQIFNVVAGNTLKLTAYDFSGTVYFDANGQLSAVDNYNQRDVGRWDLNDKNQLCLRFRLWYYGDIKCYTVFDNPAAAKFTFFTTNGAAYYTAMLEEGDPASLETQIKKGDGPRYVRRQIAAQQGQTTSTTPTAASAPPDKIEITESGQDDSRQTVQRLAGDCPGCNMAGIDLKEASLIKANLQGADLNGADLRYANLRRANLNGANLKGARLNHANLPGADLSNADLTDADLSGANLLLTNFTGATLSGAKFTNANLEKTIGLTNTP